MQNFDSHSMNSSELEKFIDDWAKSLDTRAQLSKSSLMSSLAQGLKITEIDSLHNSSKDCTLVAEKKKYFVKLSENGSRLISLDAFTTHERQLLLTDMEEIQFGTRRIPNNIAKTL